METSHEFLTSLAVVFSVAAATTLVSKRLRLPLVFGYIMAGMIVGPYIPVPLMASQNVVQTLAELGLILIMFSLGLEFSIAKLVRLAGSAGIIALLQCSVMFLLGMAAARAFGWSTTESIFTGALIAISSTAIIVKAFEDQRLSGTRLADLVVGILIYEDVIAILLLVVLTALGRQGEIEARVVAETGAGVLLFVAVSLAAGMALLPRLVRWIKPRENPELAVVFLIGVCFFFAVSADYFGYSIALGAFLGGAVLAGAVHDDLLHRMLEPIKNMFGAVFFVAVGMLVNPALMAENWAIIAVLLAVVVAGKIVSVSVGGVLTGIDSGTALRAGLSLAQIGEFSFVIAALGVELGVARPSLYAVAVAVSALTTLSTPSMVKYSERLAASVDRRLPHRLQTSLALYAAWFTRLRAHRADHAERSRLRKLARNLAIDVAALIVLEFSLALLAQDVTSALSAHLGLSVRAAKWAVSVLWLAAIAPFLYGILRIGGAMGGEYARRLWPEHAPGELDLSNAPRSALTTMVQLSFTLLSATVAVAVSAPILPEWESVFILLVLIVPMLYRAWKTAGNLQGHVRASAQLVTDALSRNAAPGTSETPQDRVMAEIIAGLGGIKVVTLGEHDFAAGKSLGILNLRGATCATVISIQRPGAASVIPTGNGSLMPGDRIALAGSPESTEMAERLLHTGSLHP